MKQKSLLAISGCLLLGSVVIMSGCQSGNTDGGTVDNTGTQYDPNNAGGVRVSLEDGDELQTGAKASFRVHATDSDGNPVINLPITCDTEAGLALIEPTTGVESTDANGQMSGKIGCEKPGSYLLACRGQNASNDSSVTVRCEGLIPAGFDGFPGAGGGGLGGGSGANGTTRDVRVTSLSIFDDGSDTSTTSIDVVQGTCTSGSTTTAEPYYDSNVSIQVVNDSPYLVTFDSLRYTVSDATAAGNTITSGSLSVTGTAAAGILGNGGTGTINSLLLQATSSGKKIYGTGNTITSALSGFKNLTFTLTGTNEIGEDVTVTTQTALSFSNFNRCPSS